MRNLSLRLMSLAVLCAAAALAFPVQSSAQARTDALILSPEPGERVPEDAVLVAVSFLGESAALEGLTITMHVDGRDVTAEAELRGDVVTWRPRVPLAPGPHRVVIVGHTSSGMTVGTANWSFTVGPAVSKAELATRPREMTTDARPHGSFIVEGTSSSVSGSGAEFKRQEDFLPVAWLNAAGTIRPGWRYSARVHVSGYESNDQQPVNRYRLDLRTPMLSLGLGDVNPVLHELIIAGRRVRGAQAELRAGPARLTIVHGQSKRAISALLDPTNPTQVGRLGVYQQNVIAVRPALGSGTRFQIGLTALRVRDDVNSIADLRTQPFTSDGATLSANAQPKDNLVAGLDMSLRLARGRVLLQYANAASLLANDISGGPLTKAGLDSLLDSSGKESINIDPSQFERFFIINSSMIPLDPRGLTNVAHQARTSIRAGSHMLSVEWQSIGGSYHTLAQPGLQRDRRGIRVRDSFTLLNDALVVSAGYERDRDNLDDVKTSTTTSGGTFGSVTWQKSPNSVMLTSAVRFGTRNNDVSVGTDGSLDESNRLVSGGVSVPVSLLSGLRTRLTLSGFVVERTDAANEASDTRDLYYIGGVQGETPDRDSEFALLLGMNRTQLLNVTDGDTDYYRVVGNARHRIATRWKALFDGTYTAARSPELSTSFGPRYNRAEFLTGGEFEWNTSAVLSLTGGVVSYADQQFTGRDTREFVVRLRLNRAF